MRDFTGIGLFVSKISTLFSLWKALNVQVGFKTWKIWEDRPENIANIPKNDIIVLEDDPIEEATVSALDAYVRGGGILVYLFPVEMEASFEDAMVDGRIASGTFTALLDGIDVNEFAARNKDLSVKIALGEGVIVSLSRNVFTSEPEPGAEYAEERVDNLDFFMNLMKYLAGVKAALDAKKADAIKAPASKVAVMIHGAALWSDGGETSIEAIVQRVFHHLGIDALFPQVLKERPYRAIDPDLQDTFPEIYYYHCSFVEDESEARSRLADNYLDQAKAVHAIIRTEKYWEQDAQPVFYFDLARYYTEFKGLAKLYLVPPAVVGTKTREASAKLLARCFLEPLATMGVETFLLPPLDPPGGVVPCFPDIKKVKPRAMDCKKALILLHGPELAAGIKDKPIAGVLDSLDGAIKGDSPDDVLKILLHVSVDQRALQDKIKEMTINARKVEPKRRERIKKDIERLQEKLHACTRIEKDRKEFEKRGYNIIEIEDSLDVDQDAKIFFVDQVLPFILGQKISRVHELLPAALEAYFTTASSPLIPAGNVARVDIK
ncbi:MAG: hypothetical protein GYA24_11685 [Candidatus Lokiarchaeota archaeon]|nr:hypothetical protein [Candidatus Lokiarchaeota archaeon]